MASECLLNRLFSKSLSVAGRILLRLYGRDGNRVYPYESGTRNSTVVESALALTLSTYVDDCTNITGQ